MAGRRAPSRKATVFVQTPKVADVQTQRAFDAHHQAILDLQARRHLEQFTATEPGYVPASGGSASDFLCADGTWKTVSGSGGGVDEVTAGSSMVSVSPTTGTVVVDVVPSNFTGIPMSGITFSGTNNRVAKFSGATIADSSITDTGALITVASATTVTGAVILNSTLNGQGAADFDSTLNVDGAGTFQSTIHGIGAVDFDSTFNADGAGTFGSTLGVAGNFSVATNKFTVAATTGNTLVAGTLDVTGNFAVATNKFTVTAASGNTNVAGTLNSTGDFSVATNKFTVASATGNTVLAGTFTLSPMTLGSVPYISTAGLFIQANSNFFYDDTNKQLLLTSTTTALQANNNSLTTGQIAIKNTNVSGPTDFYAQDNGGTTKISWGYGNGSFSDSARQSRGYLWRVGALDFVIARTGVVDMIVKSDGKVGIGTSTTLTALLEANGSRPDIYVNGTVSNMFRCGTGGAAAPTTVTRSDGTKIVLYPEVGVGLVDYAIGINSATMWYSVSTGDASHFFRWYGGTTVVATLDGVGSFNCLLNLSCDGSFTAGNASTDTHTINGRVTQSSTISTAHAYGLTWTPSAGATATQAALSITSNGTFTTAGGALSEYGLRVTASSTRSAGANNLTNVAGYFTSSGAQVNVALQTDAGDILLNQTGGTFSCAGAGTFTTTLGVTGDFAVNTNKFTVTASNGNTLVAGTLSVTSDVAVNTNKFTVTASSGNTAVAGTLDVTGTTTLKGTAVVCDGTGDTLKFYGGTGATQQTITGSRAGNAALADLLTKLATLGLIVDSTSA